MPSSVVHLALALALVAGLLGRFYSRTTLGVVFLVVLVPEVDTVIGFVVAGAHRTLLHNLVLPGLAIAVLGWDTRREESWLRTRFGPAGVRVAWVAIFVHVFAHLLFDWSHLEGINLFWPLHDQFFRLDGELYLSSENGLVQTFVELRTDPDTGRRIVDAGGGGTRQETFVPNPAQPSPEPEPGPVERVFPIAVHGWQLFVVFTGVFVGLAKRLQSPSSGESR